MSVLARVVEFTGTRPGKQVWVWCPGCDQMHPFTIEAPTGPEGDRLNSGITWEWDGNLERPTFSPSLLCPNTFHICEGEHQINECASGDFEVCGHRSHGYAWKFPDGSLRHFKVWETKPADAVEVVTGPDGPHPRDPAWGGCHSFLRAGRWEFLTDSAHRLAGQTVDMVPLKGTWAGSED